jgi:hypothetical protein
MFNTEQTPNEERSKFAVTERFRRQLFFRRVSLVGQDLSETLRALALAGVLGGHASRASRVRLILHGFSSEHAALYAPASL